jgi:nucleotide-binding universal stress UspA family protein
VKEVIYLKVSRQRVEGMTKNLPDLKRGEIPVKLEVIVDPAVFGVPTIEQAIHVTDWREGLAFPGVDLTDLVITEAEAEMIRAQRLEAMRAALEQHGYTVTEPLAEGEHDA